MPERASSTRNKSSSPYFTSFTPQLGLQSEKSHAQWRTERGGGEEVKWQKRKNTYDGFCQIFINQESSLSQESHYGKHNTKLMKKSQSKIPSKNVCLFCKKNICPAMSSHYNCVNFKTVISSGTRVSHGTYIIWQLRTCCARMKVNRSFPKKNQICNFSLSNHECIKQIK